MDRTERLVSRLRWTVVGMHTVLVVSVSHYLAMLAVPGSKQILAHSKIAALLMAIDLPVTVVTVLPAHALAASSPDAGIELVLFLTIFVLLGGLQWYLIVSLLVRLTCGFKRTIAAIGTRRNIVVFFCFLLVGGFAIIPWYVHLIRLLYPRYKGPYTPPTVAFSGDSKELRQSLVVPTLDTPIVEGRNVIWCGTLQLAWNRLGKDVLHQPPQIQGAEALVSRLNQAKLGEDDLPPNSYLATAGFVKDGVVKSVKSEMEQRFRKDIEIDAMAPNDILAYAYLEANADFTIPFFDYHGESRFRDHSGKETEVTSFGIEERHEYAYRRLREQIDVLYLLRNKTDLEELDEFVIDLCRDSSPNQILVAHVPRKPTLLEMLNGMEKKMEEFAREPMAEYLRRFGVRDVLLVPNLNWEIRHRFAELEGTDKRFLNAGFSGYHIAKALQTIRFKLDRSGAELASEAQVQCKPMATHFVCNGPFLIVVKKRGAERPFFVMWVDNAELLSKP